MQTIQEHLIDTIDFFPTFCLSESLQKVFQQAKKITAKGTAPILITGERGTGKEFLAKNIHYLTSSVHLPFFAVNCSHLPFDHFAIKMEQYLAAMGKNSDDKVTGNKASGNAGTIFLRDVGKLAPPIQGKVFDLLKELCGKFVRSSKPFVPTVHLMFSYSPTREKSDVHSPCQEVLHKTFHPDTLTLLPLRDRLDDIQPLASFFVDRFSKEYSKDIGGIHSEALAALKSHAWPNNVSELKNVMENAVLLAQNPLITREDIRFNISKKSIALESFFGREDFFQLEEIERIYIQTVLRRVKNNKSKAANILGITRNTLQKRIDSFVKAETKHKARKKSRQPTLPFPG
jgi:two-component system response regulator HydG